MGKAMGRIEKPRPEAGSTANRQVGLRHLMAVSAVLAVPMAAVVQAYRTEKDGDIILAILAVAASLVGFGAFASHRMPRYSGFGWFLIGIGPILASVVIVGASTGWSVYGIVITIAFELPVVIGVVIHLLSRHRAVEQEALLWVLALASSRDRPLSTAVRALAGESPGGQRVRLRNLAGCLELGMSLPDALEFVPGTASPASRLIVRVGHDSGRLAEALADASAGRSADPPGWRTFGIKVAYLCFVALAIQWTGGFILYFVTPKFEAILRDFQVAMPPMTLWVIRASQSLSQGYTLPILATIEGLLLVYLIFAFVGFGNLDVPFLDRAFARRHAILILRSLGLVVAGDRPIGLGLKILSLWYPTGWVRERLEGASLATSHGHDWIEALRHFALIGRSDAAVLDAARRTGNLPWALNELAEGSARRLGYRLQAIGQVALTAVLLTLGAAVALLCVAYFLPLITMIEALV